MKKAAAIALVSYVLLVATVLYGSWAKANGAAPYHNDALGLIGFIFMVLYIIIAGVVVPAIYLHKRYNQIEYTSNEYSPLMWVIGLSILLLSIPVRFMDRATITPKWISYPTMMALCTIGAFGFMVFSILGVLQIAKLL